MTLPLTVAVTAASPDADSDSGNLLLSVSGRPWQGAVRLLATGFSDELHFLRGDEPHPDSDALSLFGFGV